MYSLVLALNSITLSFKCGDAIALLAMVNVMN